MPQNGLNKAQTWLNITGHIQADMLKPFRPLESATGGCQKHPKMANFEPKETVFGRLWGLPGDIFWRPNGPNWPPWMCLTMFNHVQPMFNPFGLAGTAYGQIWPFRVKKGVFGRFWGPPVTISGGLNGPNRLAMMCLALLHKFAALFNQVGPPGATYGQIWHF